MSFSEFHNCTFTFNTGLNPSMSCQENITPQLFGISVDAALATLESTLGMIAPATASGVDDHVLAYVRALRKSPELVGLLEKDFGNVAPASTPAAQAVSISTIMAIISLVRAIQATGLTGDIFQRIKDLIAKFGSPGAQVQAASFDPQALDFATIMQLIALVKQFLELIGKLKGSVPGLPSGPQSSYAPNDVARCP